MESQWDSVTAWWSSYSELIRTGHKHRTPTHSPSDNSLKRHIFCGSSLSLPQSQLQEDRKHQICTDNVFKMRQMPRGRRKWGDEDGGSDGVWMKIRCVIRYFHAPRLRRLFKSLWIFSNLFHLIICSLTQPYNVLRVRQIKLIVKAQAIQ